VHGWLGARPLDLRITRTHDGIWTLNGQVVSHLDGCVDLDLGFTPATNLFQLRRVALQVGQAADVPVAWLDVPVGTLDPLHQRYERRADATIQLLRPSSGQRSWFRGEVSEPVGSGAVINILGISVPAVSQSVKRVGELAGARGYSLVSS
jgi:hypothetical protein